MNKLKNNKLKIEDIILKFKGKPFFTFKELYEFYKGKETNLKIGTFKWRIYKLKEKGIIKDLKRGVYKLGSFKEFIPIINSDVKRLYNYLIKAYPYVQIDIWETSWLHDFMNHQPFNSFIIVEVDKDVLESAFYLLKEKRNYVYFNPKGEDIEKYITNENVIIVKSIIKGSPNTKIEKINIPKIEKILVDIFFESNLFRTYQGQELINIFERVFEEYTINLTTLLRYARKRGIKEKINNFIIDTIKIKSSLFE
ncbi:MAG: DUF6577 family protein [Actinomycetota bacterium]